MCLLHSKLLAFEFRQAISLDRKLCAYVLHHWALAILGSSDFPNQFLLLHLRYLFVKLCLASEFSMIVWWILECRSFAFWQMSGRVDPGLDLLHFPPTTATTSPSSSWMTWTGGDNNKRQRGTWSRKSKRWKREWHQCRKVLLLPKRCPKTRRRPNQEKILE